MNPYYVPDEQIPSWVDDYDAKPHICPECGCEINKTIYIKDGMVIGCENCIKWFDAGDVDADRYFEEDGK